MDEESARSLYHLEIEHTLAALVPDGSGAVTSGRLGAVLDHVAQVAFAAGCDYALTNLMSVDEAASEIGVSRRRMEDLVRRRHAQLGICARIGPTWVIARDELNALRPGRPGKPKKTTMGGES